MTESTPDFIALQRRFAAHLRDARETPPPGIEARRLAIYRRLFFNPIADALNAAFPVLQKILGDARWTTLLHEFHAEYRSRYPQLHRLPEAFVEYLHEARGLRDGDPPFLRDLAHYEWVELALSIAEDVAIDEVDREADLLQSPPVLSPLCWVLAYEYPVHRIGPGTAADAEPTYLAVYRDAGDAVKFVELNALSAQLLTRIAAQPQASGNTLLVALAEELAHPQPEQLVAAGGALLDDLRRRGLIVGARRV